MRSRVPAKRATPRSEGKKGFSPLDFRAPLGILHTAEVATRFDTKSSCTDLSESSRRASEGRPDLGRAPFARDRIKGRIKEKPEETQKERSQGRKAVCRCCCCAFVSSFPLNGQEREEHKSARPGQRAEGKRDLLPALGTMRVQGA